MERKIGEVFEYNNVKLQVNKNNDEFSCRGCYFIDKGSECDEQKCLRSEREDRKNVIFEEINNKSMTREEELQKAAVSFCDKTNPQLLVGDYSFIQGAKWADNNPKSPWISTEKDLPCNHPELISPDDKRDTKYVVAMIHGHIVLSRMYKLDGKWHWENDEPTHWFPIPEPPKE